jgi:hypothetical protein
MPTQIRLLPQQIADLAAVRDLGPERLQVVLAHLQGLQPLPLRPAILHGELTQALDNDERAAEHLLRPVLALYQLIRQREMTVDEVMDGLRHGIAAADPPWTEDQRTAWDNVAPIVRGLFQIPAVRIVSKAIDLAYEYANLFQGARIVTDVRPVFNDEDDDEMRIDGAVVSFTLRLHYDNREGNHSLSIALDEADVRTLQGQCERALRKATMTRSRIQDAGIPTVISGESTDEPD